MKIGVYFTPRQGEGGVYQYSYSILEALSKIKKHQYTIITTSPDVPKKYKKLKNFQIVDLRSSVRDITIKTRNLGSYFLEKLAPHLLDNLHRLGWYHFLTPLYKLSLSGPIKAINGLNLDLVFYPTSSNLSFLAKPAAIVAIHDLEHRKNPQFKEVSAGGRWAHREYGFISICKKAFRILVDSKIGKEDVLKYYSVLPQKVTPLPFLAPSYLNPNINKKTLNNISKKLKLPQKFIYYPAKFWPHKNHINLVKAIHLLKKQGKNINLILTGSKEADFSTYPQVMDLIKKSKLQNQIHYLGYVTSLEQSVIYKLATAMVMPTFFGPTNIPILEAWQMGTPVITSNLKGNKAQLGNAGLLINPHSPQSIAGQIKKIYNNSKLQKDLVTKGKKRASKWTIIHFSKRIKNMVDAFEKIHIYD